jgi:serine phosphatase RsbU (regulator of sigma subunit)
MATLSLYSHATQQKHVLQGRLVYTIGSAPDNWLRLEDETVHPHHAIISIAGEKIKIQKFQEHVEIKIQHIPIKIPGYLKHGDVLTLGKIEFEFQAETRLTSQFKFSREAHINKMVCSVDISSGYPAPGEKALLTYQATALNQEQFGIQLLGELVALTKAYGGLLLVQKQDAGKKIEDCFTPLAVKAPAGETLAIPYELFTNAPHAGNLNHAKVLVAAEAMAKSGSSGILSCSYCYLPLLLKSQWMVVLLVGTFGNHKNFQDTLPALCSAAGAYIIPMLELLGKYNVQEAELQTAQQIISYQEAELKAANAIQASLLPVASRCQQIEVPVSLDIWGVYRPAGQVGGDYLDILFSQDESQLYFCIGDVSGKGQAASLVMATVRAYFRLLASQGVRTNTIVEQLNRHLHQDLHKIGKLFVTMMVFRWDEMSGQLFYTPAGTHLWIIRQDGSVSPQERTGTIIGMRDKLSEEQKEESLLPLAEGEILVLATDGVWEARNQKEEAWEDQENNFITSLRQSPKTSALAVLHHLLNDLECFTAGVGIAHDDISLLVIQKKAKPIVMVDRFLKLYQQGKVENIEQVMKNLKTMLESSQ